MIETFVLIGIILYLGAMNYIERQKAAKRETDLLNRLMSTNFQEYAHVVKSLEHKDKSLKDASPTELLNEIQAKEALDPDILRVD